MIINSSGWLAVIIGCSFAITVAGLPTNRRERLRAIEARSASRVGIGQRLFDARQRQVLAAVAAQAIEIHRGREPFGLGVGLGRDRGDRQNAVRRRRASRMA